MTYTLSFAFDVFEILGVLFNMFLYLVVFLLLLWGFRGDRKGLFFMFVGFLVFVVGGMVFGESHRVGVGCKADGWLLSL